MSWVVTAVVSTALSIGNSVYQAKQQKKASKQARADAIAAEKQARKAEIFADTEGEGIGQLAQISLEVDDTELDEELSTSNTVRI